MEYILNHSDEECIFCTKLSENADRKNYVLERGRLAFVIMNIFPYNTGHIMIAPNRHVDSLVLMEDDEMMDLFRLVRNWEAHLRKAYNPQAFNIGANIGRPAGAGVVGHFHMHVVPRWTGDTSHMTVISNTKVIPQSLDATYQQLITAMKA
jgi:ATP adenylyltransferase